MHYKPPRYRLMAVHQPLRQIPLLMHQDTSYRTDAHWPICAVTLRLPYQILLQIRDTNQMEHDDNLI